MKYVSIDIETMGLHPECSVIEFAAVIDDGRPLDELPTFHRYLGPQADGTYRCEPHCFEMHADKLTKLRDGIQPDQLWGQFVDWLQYKQIEIPFTAAGKNFASFDAPRLLRLPGFNRLWHHRILDPSILYLEPSDEVLPNTAECLRRAGLEPTESHTALGDALDAVRLLRSKL